MVILFSQGPPQLQQHSKGCAAACAWWDRPTAVLGQICGVQKNFRRSHQQRTPHAGVRFAAAQLLLNPWATCPAICNSIGGCGSPTGQGAMHSPSAFAWPTLDTAALKDTGRCTQLTWQQQHSRPASTRPCGAATLGPCTYWVLYKSTSLHRVHAISTPSGNSPSPAHPQPAHWEPLPLQDARSAPQHVKTLDLHQWLNWTQSHRRGSLLASPTL